MTRFSIVLATALALGTAGIGIGCDSSSPSPNPGAGAAPPPRPGEDEMKNQMEKFLAKKGRLPKGVLPPAKKSEKPRP